MEALILDIVLPVKYWFIRVKKCSGQSGNKEFRNLKLVVCNYHFLIIGSVPKADLCLVQDIV